MITDVAVKIGDNVYSKKLPSNHGELTQSMIVDHGIEWPFRGDVTEGFLNEDGTFLDRYWAAKWAIDSGQVRAISNEFKGLQSWELM